MGDHEGDGEEDDDQEQDMTYIASSCDDFDCDTFEGGVENGVGRRWRRNNGRG